MNFESLGKALTSVTEKQTEAEPIIQDVRRRLLETPAPQAKHSVRSSLMAAALLISVLGSAWALENWLSVKAISFTAAGMEGREGNWIAAEKQSERLSFSEGSVVVLGQGTRLRVSHLSAEGAELVIERGVAHAAFVPHGNARWLLNAGPFSVEVTGTRFELSWDPENERLALLMTEGSVLVDGPLIAGKRRVVVGETLQVDLHKREMRLSSAENSTANLVESAVAKPEAGTNFEPLVVLDAEHVGGSTPVSDAKPVSPEAAVDSDNSSRLHDNNSNAKGNWRVWLKEGQSEKALQQLTGDAQVLLRQGTSEELLRLADVARLSGHAKLALQALLVARDLRGVRENTAFLLGKISADQLGQTQQAATWFKTYLDEQPKGALHQQALGRLLEIRSSHGSTEVQALAARYLQQYPDGAYSELARSLLKESVSEF